MEELPHLLRREISYSINRKVFKQLSLFHDFPAREQALIAASMTPVQACRAALTLKCAHLYRESLGSFQARTPGSGSALGTPCAGAVIRNCAIHC